MPNSPTTTDIDFVITWLDPSDPKWRKAYEITSSFDRYRDTADLSALRYRDWGNLKYWFRGIERYAPWVRKIHFITFGHLPDWLNRDHPKLNIVRHDDYISNNYLPTFNSRTLELNLVDIDELAENFVLFNDDFFALDTLDPELFFHEGLPCDFAILNAYSGDGISPVLMNNLRHLNRHFDKRQVLRSRPGQWLNLSYRQYLLRTLLLLAWPRFTGFFEPHLPQPYSKSHLKESWSLFGEAFKKTCQSQFRLSSDVNHYLFRYHHLVSGRFHPITPQARGRYFEIADNNVDEVSELIESGGVPLLTINDGEVNDFDSVKQRVNASFAHRFPDASDFERCPTGSPAAHPLYTTIA